MTGARPDARTRNVSRPEQLAMTAGLCTGRKCDHIVGESQMRRRWRLTAAMLASLVQVGHVSSLLVRQVPGVCHSRSNPAPSAFPSGRNKIEIERFQRSE